MKTVLSLSLPVLLLGVGLWSLRSPPTPSEFTAGLVARPTEIDLGQVTAATGSMPATFHLVNASDRPIEIRSSLLTCACTDIDLKPQTLKPGQSIPVHLRVEPRSNDPTFSSIVRVFWVGDGDEKLHKTAVRVKARLMREFEISSRDLTFPPVDEVQYLHLRRIAGETPLRLREAYSSHPSMTTTVVEESRDEATIAIAFDRSKWLDMKHVASVRIDLADPRETFEVKLRVDDRSDQASTKKDESP